MAYPSFVENGDSIIARIRRPYLISSPTFGYSSSSLLHVLIKEASQALADDRVAVRFAYEWHDDSGHWFRSYGNENWEFDEQGLMKILALRYITVQHGDPGLLVRPVPVHLLHRPRVADVPLPECDCQCSALEPPRPGPIRMLNSSISRLPPSGVGERF